MENIQNYKDALASVSKKEMEQRKTIKRLLQEKEELKKQCDTLVVSNQRELLQYFCELTNITHDAVNQDIEDTIHKFNAL